MSNRDAICQAIRERRLLQFYYDGGTRVVDPHQLAYNERENVWETGTGLAITHCRNARPDPVNLTLFNRRPATIDTPLGP